MRSSALGLCALSVFQATVASARQPPSSHAVLLSNIQSLTLRADRKTSHRRVSAIPQLKCVGGNAKGKYEVDAMRCTNQGTSYSGADVEWSCTASLPEDFKLGSTDVICEGYSGPDDEFVLKGSCGVQYRLVLTDRGEEKYASSWFKTTGEKEETGSRSQVREERSEGIGPVDRLITVLFWILFIGVLGWMIYSAYTQRNARPRQPGRRRNSRPRGGCNWPGGGDDDPPPPYDYQPPRHKPGYSDRSANQGWRPGFWSGLGAGGAAGYAAGRMTGRSNTTSPRPGTSGGATRDWGNGGEGSSGTRSSTSAASSTRYTSTGFGSTSRR